MLEEITVKVLPQPESACTVLVAGLDPAAATRAMQRALASPHEVSGAAYLPGATAPPAPAGMADIAAFRLEGPAPSVGFRRERLLLELAAERETAVLDDMASAEFWRAVGDAASFAGLAGRAVWRISVAPSRGAGLGETIGRASMPHGISIGAAGCCGRRSKAPRWRRRGDPRRDPRRRRAAAPGTRL